MELKNFRAKTKIPAIGPFHVQDVPVGVVMRIMRDVSACGPALNYARKYATASEIWAHVEQMSWYFYILRTAPEAFKLDRLEIARWLTALNESYLEYYRYYWAEVDRIYAEAGRGDERERLRDQLRERSNVRARRHRNRVLKLMHGLIVWDPIPPEASSCPF